MMAELERQYQNFTQADMTKFRETGYTEPATTPRHSWPSRHGSRQHEHRETIAWRDSDRWPRAVHVSVWTRNQGGGREPGEQLS